MQTLWQDFRYAVRTLLKNPGFALIAIATLAVAIAANTTIFSVVNSVLLRPLKYPNPEQLVLVSDTQPPATETPADYAEYLDWREQATIFQHLAAYFNTTYTLTGQGDPQQLPCVLMSANTLPALGVNPILGRNFRQEEEARTSERVVLIGYGFWQRQFAGDPNVLGRTITLADRSFSIIGVLPSTFKALSPSDVQTGQERDVWIPLRLDTKVAPRGLHFLTVFGRLRPDVSMAQANAAMETLNAHLQQARSIKHGPRLIPLEQSIVPANMRTSLLLLLGAIGFVLLIACANVANLLLARATARQKEIAIRLALGASRGRIITQLLTESLILALTAGAVGLLLSLWGVSVFTAAAKTLLPRVDEISPDLRVLAFTAGISILTGLLFGLAPALRASKGDMQEPLKEGGRAGVGGAQQRLRGLLVVTEMALSMVLLIGAGLLVKSFVRVLTSDRGFDSEQVLLADLSLSLAKYDEPHQQAQFFQQFLESVRAIPGVEAVAIVNYAPLDGGGVNGGIIIEGRPDLPDQRPIAEKSIISADYFRVMRTPLLRGRVFTEQDNKDSAPVAIINESLARRYFAGEDPIGKRVDFNWDTQGTQEIVGVVQDIKQYALDLPTQPGIYVPYLQRTNASMTVVVRSSIDATSLVGAMRRQLLALEKDQPLAEVRTMQQLVAESTAQRRLMVMVSALFGVLALLLAALGLYGVMAYTVTLRTREFGLRMALGAQQRDVLKLVISKGMVLSLAGIGVGLAGAFAVTRLMRSLLFDVTPTDAMTLIAVPLLLMIVALVACCIPARRATKVDPLVALRYE